MRSVELFAGCGGLALGLARAGFAHALVAELDRHAAATLKRNKEARVEYFEEWLLREGDVREIDYNEIPQPVDLVAGGPPCQPFSIGGKHLGPSDDRNMWPEAIRAVRELNPRGFIFENVRGLLRPAFEPYLDYVKLGLQWPDLAAKPGEDWEAHLIRLRKHAKGRRGKSTYQLAVRSVDAADFGAPQHRHRVVIVGVRSNVATDWTFPRPTHSRDALLWSKFISRDYWGRHNVPAPLPSPRDTRIIDRLRRSNTLVPPSGKPWLTVRDAIADLSEPATETEPIAGHRLRLGARSYKKHTGSTWDEPAKALKAGAHGVPGGENMLDFGDGAVRYFTLREMARLQGFPDKFDIGEGWKGPVRQLGNAVPVQVGERLGTWMAGLLRAASGEARVA